MRTVGTPSSLFSTSEERQPVVFKTNTALAQSFFTHARDHHERQNGQTQQSTIGPTSFTEYGGNGEITTLPRTAECNAGVPFGPAYLPSSPSAPQRTAKQPETYSPQTTTHRLLGEKSEAVLHSPADHPRCLWLPSGSVVGFPLGIFPLVETIVGG